MKDIKLRHSKDRNIENISMYHTSCDYEQDRTYSNDNVSFNLDKMNILAENEKIKYSATHSKDVFLFDENKDDYEYLKKIYIKDNKELLTSELSDVFEKFAEEEKTIISGKGLSTRRILFTNLRIVILEENMSYEYNVIKNDDSIDVSGSIMHAYMSINYLPYKQVRSITKDKNNIHIFLNCDNKFEELSDFEVITVVTNSEDELKLMHKFLKNR